MRMYLLLLAVALGITPALAQNPPKLANTARLDFVGNASVGGLNNAQIITGSGSFTRMTWLAAAEQPRSYSFNLGIVHFGWDELVIRFTPTSSGSVEMRLLGPWEQTPEGPIYQQEIIWDHFTGTNTVVNNGSFETVSGGTPTGWFRAYGSATVESGPPTPVHGARYARTWHDNPLATQLQVTAGQPVTLRFFARAQLPPRFVDMTPQPTNSPAHLAAKKFLRGANFGNYLEAPPNTWGNLVYTAADFAAMRAEGFDHVRLPVGWQYYTGAAPDYTLPASIFQKVDFIVTNALAHNLAVMINVHHFDDLTTNPPAQTNRFNAIWRQIAAHYSNSPPGLAFELLNEPKDAATTTVMNSIYAETIRQIRQTNPDRTIFVGPGNFNNIDQLPSLKLLNNDANLIVTLHSYDPFLFTHQGADWPGPDSATRGVQFPGPPQTPLVPAAGIAAWATNWIHDYNTLPTAVNPSSPAAFRGKLAQAKKWSDYYGRPIHIGEFGAYEIAPAASRDNFYREMRAAMDELGIGWAIWDWKAGFKYWDGTRNAPVNNMRDSLFPVPRLKSSLPQQFRLESAVGKTYWIQKSNDLGIGWETISTQTLATPILVFNDPEAETQAFYRVQWVK